MTNMIKWLYIYSNQTPTSGTTRERKKETHITVWGVNDDNNVDFWQSYSFKVKIMWWQRQCVGYI